MRYGLMVFLMLLGSASSTMAQVSIGVGIGLPGVNIGINLPVYPDLVQVPGYPVYYAPRLNSNFFFYDGLYWVYQEDNWYASTWYNGPWELVAPQVVPVFVLRIPVRYYRVPPVYFRGWRADAPPRWGEHWGPSWQQGRTGWDRWDRRAAPAPAPLPVYQRRYSGERYPRVEQQRELREQNYRHQPRDAVVRQRFQEQEVQRSNPPQKHGGPAVPRPQPRQNGGEEMQRQREPAAQTQRPQPSPREAAPQERHGPRPGPGPGQGQGRDRVIENEERGPGRNR
jgi:hypothetical protein